MRSALPEEAISRAPGEASMSEREWVQEGALDLVKRLREPHTDLAANDHGEYHIGPRCLRCRAADTLEGLLAALRDSGEPR